MLYKDNPFYVLGVSLEDNRREIVRLAEEKSLLLDSQECNEARTILTNPQRRIIAETHWFVDCSPEQEALIREYVASVLDDKSDEDFSLDDYSPLTQLNIQFACIDAQSFQNPSKAKYYILSLSRLFEAVDTDEVLAQINDKRQLSGFPAISKSQDVDDALSEIRKELRQALSQKLQSLPEAAYTQVVTSLAESYSGNERYRGNAVLEDVIAEYQLYINDALQKKGQEITKTAKFIAQGAKSIRVEDAVSDLIATLYAWDKLAQPLQLGALTRGSSHVESEEMLTALRQLALKLHNDYGMSSESLAITKATQEVFKELPEYTELLGDDNKTLTRLIQEKEVEEQLEKEAKDLLDELESLQKESKSVNNYTSQLSIDGYISRVKRLDEKIKLLRLDAETIRKLRETLCYLARNAAIELHNTKHQTSFAHSIIGALCKEFGDIPTLKSKLDTDFRTLGSQLILSNRSTGVARTSSQTSSEGSGCLVRLVVVAVIIALISVFSNIGSSSPSSAKSSSSSSNYSSSSYSTPRPTIKPTPIPEVVFSSSVPSGTKVYADIVSIFPEYGVYQENSMFYHHFVCKCSTASGATIWVYMSVSDYKNHFDSNASSLVSDNYADEVTFSSAKRIHGTTKRAEAVLTGLSSSTASIVIDFSSLS